MRTTCLSLTALCAVLTSPSLNPVIAQSASDSATAVAILNKHARTPQLSPALEEIVKLTKAGVAEPVTLAFIQTSPTAYTLSAQDVIQLQQQGVSAQVTTALLQHGEEVRRAAAASSKPTPTTALTSAVAPVVSNPAPTYPASTVSVTYFGTPSYSSAPGNYYGYGGGYYPGFYSYAPGYYGYYAPRVAFGIGFGGIRYGGFYGSYGRCR